MSLSLSLLPPRQNFYRPIKVQTTLKMASSSSLPPSVPPSSAPSMHLSVARQGNPAPEIKWEGLALGHGRWTADTGVKASVSLISCPERESFKKLASQLLVKKTWQIAFTRLRHAHDMKYELGRATRDRQAGTQ